MKNTITEVIRATVAEQHGDYVVSQYGTTIDAVAEALASRLAGGVESLRQTAERQRLNSGIVEQAFIDAGLVEPTPEPTPEPEDEVTGLRRAVDGLLAFARQHGYRG